MGSSAENFLQESLFVAGIGGAIRYRLTIVYPYSTGAAAYMGAQNFFSRFSRSKLDNGKK